MNIETLQVAGIAPALHAMRNPLDSWEKSDSSVMELSTPGEPSDKVFCVGPADMKLSIRLQDSGPEHCKHLRMVMIWADITAPRYWWTEADTYRAGVEKVSCSTMHKLMSRPLTTDDFETDGKFSTALVTAVYEINMRMNQYREEKDQDIQKAIWREIIQLLPQSYLQKRTVMFSYAALRNIYQQRKGHKLKEWQTFREWCEGLPESWMITE